MVVTNATYICQAGTIVVIRPVNVNCGAGRQSRRCARYDCKMGNKMGNNSKIYEPRLAIYGLNSFSAELLGLDSSMLKIGLLHFSCNKSLDYFAN